MNREYERRQGKDKRPELSDLNESGQIESDASVVLFTHRPSVTRPPNDPDPPDDEIICRKNRNGPQGIVKVKFNGPYFRFENLPDKRI
jgi:replicative DNA helicase